MHFILDLFDFFFAVERMRAMQTTTTLAPTTTPQIELPNALISRGNDDFFFKLPFSPVQMNKWYHRCNTHSFIYKFLQAIKCVKNDRNIYLIGSLPLSSIFKVLIYLHFRSWMWRSSNTTSIETYHWRYKCTTWRLAMAGGAPVHDWGLHVWWSFNQW